MPGMRSLPSPLPALGLTLALVLGSAAPARAQDDPVDEPVVEPGDTPTEAGSSGSAAGPETTEAWYRFSYALAEEMVRAGRVPEAVEEYLACAALRPDDLDVVADAAVLIIEYATRVAHGLDDGSPHVAAAERLVRLGVERGGKGDGRLAYVIGRLELRRGRVGVAFEMFQEALAAGFDMDRLRPWIFVATVHRAPWLLGQGRAEDVIRGLESLLAELPAHPEAVPAKVLLAAAYRRTGDQAASDRLLELLRTEHPEDHRAWAGIGAGLVEAERWEEALEAYRRALSLAGSDRAAYSGALAATALVLHRMDRVEESEEAIRAFLELERDSPAGLRLLASIQRERGETLEALRLLRRADRISEGAPDVLELLEAVLRERGETEEADAVRARLDALRPAEAPDREPDAAREDG